MYCPLEKPQDAIKDPYMLEFIGLPEQSLAGFDLQSELISNRRIKEKSNEV